MNTSASTETLMELCSDYLKELIATASESIKSEFDSHAPFGELGVDSFHVLKIIKELEGVFGVLPKTLLFENFNIHDLANYFVENYRQVLESKFLNAPVNDGKTCAAPTPVGSVATTQRVPVVQEAEQKPVCIHESNLSQVPELDSLVSDLYANYANESSVSRGTRNIAPNLFIGSDKKGFFNYGRYKDIFLAYAFTGPADYFPVLVKELFEHCKNASLQLNIFYDNDPAEIAGIPFFTTPFGVMQRVVDIQNFTLDGKKMRRLRYQVNKFEKEGNCYTKEYTPGSESEINTRIAEVIEDWCSARTMVNPLIHRVKEEILAGNLDALHRVFLTYLEEELQNVILISKMSDFHNGYLMDLEFYGKGMPLGGLEFGIVNIIKTLVEEGCDVLSMGGTYGVKEFPSENADPALDTLLDSLREQNIFNDEGNLQFKNKFRTENIGIYLCRPKAMNNPDNVLDVVMMIADPDKMQTSDEENQLINSGAGTYQNPIQSRPSAPSVIEEKPEAATPVSNGNGDSCLSLLQQVAYNPLSLSQDKIKYDLVTDSWAKLSLPAIDKQMSRLNSQLQRPTDLDAALRDVFPFRYFTVTESGRAAEKLFCKAWRKPGAVLQNILFPTWIFSQLEHNLTPVEIPHPSIYKLTGETSQKGEIDLNLVEEKLKSDADSIAFVCIEVSNNAAGGAPISVAAVSKLKTLTEQYGKLLIMDATRVLENALSVASYQSDSDSNAVWKTIRAITEQADAITLSLAKDFCVNKGGVVATNNREIHQKITELLSEESLGLDAIDKKLISLSLQDKKNILRQVHRKVTATKTLSQTLLDANIPVVQTGGGHCILLDVASVPGFSSLSDSSAAFVASLYANTGIRIAPHNVGMQKAAVLNNLVRIAIPMGLEDRAVKTVTDHLLGFFANLSNILVLKESGKTIGLNGEPQLQYALVEHQRKEMDGIACLDSASVAYSAGLGVAQAPSENAPGLLNTLQNLTASQAAAQIEDEIAVVGLAGRYPQANNMTEMWDNLLNGRDCISDIPQNRFERRIGFERGEKYRGGFLNEIAEFDSLFFNISPREAETLDPQERLFLEVAWETLEDAGYYPEALSDENGVRNIGVYVGAVWSMYHTVGAEQRMLGNPVIASSFLWSVANRVSYFMNFSGPSMAVDTACSASLTALALATSALQKGECKAALVGGVNLDVHECKQDITVAGGLLSEEGLCRTFGKDAGGYVPGEGIGAVFLKPLEQAKKDNDQIYGLIKSVATNHGGRTSGYSVPNPKAQTQLIVSAIEKADIAADTISYIEAHGTGTELGDPIEISALNSAFERLGAQGSFCAIGSVKTNIGHLEAAAGIVGVTKVLLQMKHKQLVPSLHSAELNPYIEFENSPFVVQQDVAPWLVKNTENGVVPLRAGVSSFGAGGSNAHVILESFDWQNTVDQNRPVTEDLIFPLSARNEDQLKEQANRFKAYLESEISNASLPELQNIAHTLQVGRKSFEHRLVFIASSAEALLEQVSQYASGSRSANCLQGNAKNSDNITRLLGKQEKEGFLQLLLQGRDANKIAQAWVDGILADWLGLNVNADRSALKKVSLPTYPFAKRFHWLDRQEDTANGVQLGSAQGKKIHPLIDSNESTFERQLYKKTFTDQEFFIFDHLVSEIPTLPGVGYLDLARQAGEEALGRKVRKIKNILWVSPLAVEWTKTNEVYIELKPSGSSVQFEVFSNKEDGQKQLYSQGKLTYDDSHDGAPFEDEFIDLDGIKSRCEKVIEGKDAYPMFKSLGLHLGPQFQVLRDVLANEEEVLGELHLAEASLPTFNEFILHPSLVDGAFQAFMAAMIGSNATGEMVVPYSLGEVEIIHPLTECCYSYVTDADGSYRKESGLSKKNLLIVDESGRVLVRVKDSVGVPLTEVHEKPNKDAETNKTATDEDEGFEKLYYQHVWQESSVSDLPANVTRKKNILLFASGENIPRVLSTAKDLSIIHVARGTKYEKIDENLYQINPGNAEEYSRLFDELGERNWTAEQICFSWGEHKALNGGYSHTETSADGIEINELLSLCQAVIEKNLDATCELNYVFSSTGQSSRPQNNAVRGFINILKAENPKFVCRSIELDLDINNKKNDAEVCAFITSEWHRPVGGELGIRFSQGKRYTRVIQPFNLESSLEKEAEKHPRIKQGGTYVITGGLGGLGIIFARRLAETYRANLVLTGRSALSDDKKEILEELNQLGGNALYMPLDMAAYEDVEKLFEQCKNSFGQLNGIIHSAGVLRDSYIRNKTFEEFNAVTAAKVQGTINLDEATKDEPIDFIVLFSSLAAIAGNAGQSDYAYSNHFMDAFAEYREELAKAGSRTGKTLSINWSLWAEGGMQLDEQTELFFKRNLGIKPLSNSVGTGALERGLASSQANFAVMEGVKEKIEKAWGIGQPEVAQAGGDPVASQSPQSVSAEDEDAYQPIVRNKITDIVIDFLKLAPEDIDLDKILLDLGFDSIGLTTFANQLNDIYESDITPVLFFEYPSIREVAKYLVAEHPEAILRVHGVAAGPSQTAGENKTVAAPVVGEATIDIKSKFDASAFSENPSAQMPVATHFSFENRFQDMPIAVVGISGVMPQADNTQEYWEKLRNAENNMVTLVPEDRWSWEDYFGNPMLEKNKTLSKWGGFMREVDKFDPLFWGISPREAEMMDPQQRIFLETVWGAVEDSGHKVSELSGTKTGLFVGAATRDYIDLMASQHVELDGYSASGTSHAILVNRISFMLNIHGPSAPLDTACSSSLVALHRAIESIHTGSCEMAIVGGVQVMLTPAGHISFGAAGMLADDGKCKTFDERGNGYVRGEGSGAIFIKPLSMAEQDGDYIYGLIKATAENHGGKVTMLTAPNPNAQAELLVEAYDKAGIDPTSVGYMECHGTGTSLGDPIEIQSMKKAFIELYKKHNKPTPTTPHIGLTSAKTNIGHLETAAGVAGILKVLLSIKHKQIPALLHFEKINPYINLDKTPFYPVAKTQDWQPIYDEAGNPYPRRAGVSSFGFGGANVHVVLEEYQNQINTVDGDAENATPKLFILSAKHKDRLIDYAGRLIDHVQRGEDALSNIAYTLQVGRDEMQDRLGVIASNPAELIEKLNAFVDAGGETESVQYRRVKANQVEEPVDQASLENWFVEKNLQALLDAWLQGQSINWLQLHANSAVRRIPLPTYPFARERYWFSANQQASQASGEAVAILHPLVHKNISVLGQQAFLTELSGREKIIRNARVTQKETLPLIACIEMGREAILQSLPREYRNNAIMMENIHWVQDIYLSDKTPITINLYSLDDHRVEFEIISDWEELDHQAKSILLCRGVGSFEVTETNHNVDLLQLRKQFGTDDSALDNYRSVLESLVGENSNIRPDHVQGYLSADAQQLVELQLPLIAEDSLPEQTSLQRSRDLCWLNTICSQYLVAQGVAEEISEPLSIDSLANYHVSTEIVSVWLRLSRAQPVDENLIKLDVYLVDSSNRVCTKLKGVSFHCAKPIQPKKSIASDFERVLNSIYQSNEGDANDLFKNALDKLY